MLLELPETMVSDIKESREMCWLRKSDTQPFACCWSRLPHSVSEYSYLITIPLSSPFISTTRKQFYSRFIPATADLRTEYIYNNLMYHMLGHVTEIIGVDPWEQLISSRLFEPTGMADSAMVYEVDMDDIELATPYLLDGENLREVDMAVHIAKNAYLGVSGLKKSNVSILTKSVNLLTNRIALLHNIYSVMIKEKTSSIL